MFYGADALLLTLHFGLENKPKQSRKKHGEYEVQLKVNGSFVDIMNLVVKHMESIYNSQKETIKKHNITAV